MKRLRPVSQASLANLVKFSLAAVVGAQILYISACGKPTNTETEQGEFPSEAGQPGETETPTGPQSPNPEDVMIPVVGQGAISNQCPYGSVNAPSPIGFTLHECPIGLQQVELAENIEPLLISGDCGEKIITVRTGDRRIDTAWYTLTDGTFYFQIDGLTARLKNDGSGNTNCSVQLTVDFWGKMKCNPNDRDKAELEFQTNWWLNKGPRPSPSPVPSGSPRPTATASPIPSTVPSRVPTASPSPSPTVTAITPSPSPSPAPTTVTPSPSPTVNAPSPSPLPSQAASPLPTPSPSASAASPAPSPRLALVSNEIAVRAPVSVSLHAHPVLNATDGGKCDVPKTCYFYNEFVLKQCQ